MPGHHVSGSERAIDGYLQGVSYHGLNVRMRHGVKFVKIKLVRGVDVDVGTFVLRRVTVLRR